MKIDDPIAILYDSYTKGQLMEIARFNRVVLKQADRKLEVARKIVEQTDNGYEIPELLPIARTIQRSRLKSLSGKKHVEYMNAKREMNAEQYEKQFTPEELESDKDYLEITKPLAPRQNVQQEKVAVYSNRNLYWDAVGHLQKGYNFVTEEEAGKWLSLSGVRVVTPQEVADHFNL